MSWLKKIGTALGIVTQVVIGFGPLVTKFTPSDKDDKALPTVVDTLQHIAGLVVTAEAMGQAIAVPGADKLKMVTPLVAQAILQAEFMTGHKIQNQALFAQGCAAIGSGMADVLNSLKDDAVKTQART